MVDYNLGLLNLNNLTRSFFHLDASDPTVGFLYDASVYCGCTFPPTNDPELLSNSGPHDRQHYDPLTLRLRLASHLANHLASQLLQVKGYTCSVGIATNKLLSKLVGCVNKPRSQTTLVPPYSRTVHHENNITSFLDPHLIQRVPGIGSKIANTIRGYIRPPAPNDLQARPDDVSGSYIHNYDGDDPSFNITVHDVRSHKGINPERLERLLGGPGAPKGIGKKIFGLLHGIDDSEVSRARNVPTQISIEDSYAELRNVEAVQLELKKLSASLLRRMHIDLLPSHSTGEPITRKWIATPTTLRLSTRLRRLHLQNAGNQFWPSRTSRSIPLPAFMLSLSHSIEDLSSRLTVEILFPLFRRLHTDKGGWDLGLINIAVTGIGDGVAGSGSRDIGGMFHKLKDGSDSGQQTTTAARCFIDSDILHANSGGDNDHLYVRALKHIDGSGPTVHTVPVRNMEAGSEGFLGKTQIEDRTEDAQRGRDEARDSRLSKFAVSVEEHSSHLGSEDHLIPTQSTQTTPPRSPALHASTISTSRPYHRDSEHMLDMISDDDSDYATHYDEDNDAFDVQDLSEPCPTCGALMPAFAVPAHELFHEHGG